MGKDVAYIICGAVGDRLSEVPGSRIEECVKCGRNVWVSKETLKASGGVAACICFVCIHKQMEETKEKITLLPLSDGQKREVLDAVGDRG